MRTRSLCLHGVTDVQSCLTPVRNSVLAQYLRGRSNDDGKQSFVLRSPRGGDGSGRAHDVPVARGEWHSVELSVCHTHHGVCVCAFFFTKSRDW